MSNLSWLVIFAFALIALAGAVAWPRAGLLARWQSYRETCRRVQAEDALKHLHACGWRGAAASLDSLAGALGLRPRAAFRLVERLEALGWVRSAADGLRLTPEGELLAVNVIRAHRLWERYLADEARMSLAAIHAEAERREHDHAAEALQALEAAMGHPATDPHGDPIPTAEGRLARSTAVPLTDWPTDTPARILHIEDEPAAIFSQILAEGLRPGQSIRVIESGAAGPSLRPAHAVPDPDGRAGAQRILLSDGEKIYTLAPVVAANIYVGADETRRRPATIRPLPALQPGEQATVYALDESLQGFTRRRLLDLGLTPGAAITAELPSLFGDPMAYRVRGALIALRRDQAQYVLINLAERGTQPHA